MKQQAKFRSAKESLTEVNYMVLPSHTNALGTIFGGVMMSWIDITGAICAQRHSKRICVTASVDALIFHAPARVGDTVRLNATLVSTGRTSMTVAVTAYAENPIQDEVRLCVNALLNFVALDSKHKPTAIPALRLETASQKKQDLAARARRKALLDQVPSL